MTVRYLGMNGKTGLSISNVDCIRQRVEEAPLEVPLFDRTDLASLPLVHFVFFVQVKQYWKVVSKPL
ncbi:hypothetical protein [Enterobacter kobei]